MKKAIFVAAACILFSCSKEKTEIVRDTNSETLSKQQKEIDSLKKVIAERNSDSTDAYGSIPDITDPVLGNQEDGTENPSPEPPLKDLSGKHSLTLHYISWDKPGIINFKKTGNNTYDVAGKQQIKDEYVTVNGKITQISPLELKFEGTIVTNTELDGKCVRKGTKTFLSTKDRKYWRMQEMENCKGPSVDYIDIYFQ